jgi:hypothetical protein
MPTVEERIRALPLALQTEVEDFVAFLEERRQSSSPGAPALKWAGALSDMAAQYSSVELQHALADWRAPQEVLDLAV